MIKGLKRFAAGGLLIRELRALRQEMEKQRAGMERIAAALEAANAHRWPQRVQPDPDQPAVEISYVEDAYQQALMGVELELLRAKGQPPTEDEILAEYERQRFSGSDLGG